MIIAIKELKVKTFCLYFWIIYQFMPIFLYCQNHLSQTIIS